MKELIGSFKQVEWANSIRRSFIERCESQIKSSASDNPSYLRAAEKSEKLRSAETIARRLEMHEKFSALLKSAELQNKAKFWIENRDKLEEALGK